MDYPCSQLFSFPNDEEVTPIWRHPQMCRGQIVMVYDARLHPTIMTAIPHNMYAYCISCYVSVNSHCVMISQWYPRDLFSISIPTFQELHLPRLTQDAPRKNHSCGNLNPALNRPWGAHIVGVVQSTKWVCPNMGATPIVRISHVFTTNMMVQWESKGNISLMLSMHITTHTTVS